MLSGIKLQLYSKSAAPGDILELVRETEACTFGIRANWSMALLQEQDTTRKLSENHHYTFPLSILFKFHNLFIVDLKIC